MSKNSFVENINLSANSSILADGDIVEDTQVARDAAVKAAQNALLAALKSEDSSELAQEWAVNAVNEPISGTEADPQFSSYHYSRIAQLAVGNPLIDDHIISQKYTWSSSKISLELAKKSDTTHTHSGTYEPVITPKLTAFNKNFSVSGGDAGVAVTVAREDHLHDERYEPIVDGHFDTDTRQKGTAFNKDFGRNPGMVMEGDANFDNTYMKISSYTVNSGAQFNPTNIPWVINTLSPGHDEVPRGTHTHEAGEIGYDNTVSSLASNYVQGAIDELAGQTASLTTSEISKLIAGMTDTLFNVANAGAGVPNLITAGMTPGNGDSSKNAILNGGAGIQILYPEDPTKMIEGQYNVICTMVMEDNAEYKIGYAINGVVRDPFIDTVVGAETHTAGTHTLPLSLWLSDINNGDIIQPVLYSTSSAQMTIAALTISWSGAPSGSVIITGVETLTHNDIVGRDAVQQHPTSSIYETGSIGTDLDTVLTRKANKIPALSIIEDNFLIMDDTGDLKDSGIALTVVEQKMNIVPEVIVGDRIDRIVTLTSSGDAQNSGSLISDFALTNGNVLEKFKVANAVDDDDAVSLSQLKETSLVASSGMPKVSSFIAGNFAIMEADGLDPLGGTAVSSMYNQLSFADASHLHSFDTVTDDGLNPGPSNMTVRDALDTKYTRLVTPPPSGSMMSIDDIGEFQYAGFSQSQVTLKGNDFNGSSQLVQTTILGRLPTLDGSNLYNVSSTVDGDGVELDTSNFDNNLSPADNTVQKALDTLDNMIVGDGGGTGDGDMLKSVYDKNENGIVDNSALVNGLSVNTAVPAEAVFTDTVYDDTSIYSYINYQDGLSYVKTDYTSNSNGQVSGGKPIILNGDGMVDPSMISINSFTPISAWTPTAGNEYPDTSGLAVGSFWWIEGVDDTLGYTFVDVGGDLEGTTAYNGEMMVLATSGFVIMEGSMDPSLYYRLDGNSSITGNFAGGGFQLTNIADGALVDDGATFGQLTTGLNGKEPSLPGNTFAGYVLSDNGLGVRSWIEMSGGSGSGVASLTTDTKTGATGDVIINAYDVSLGSVDNTADADKPVSDDTQTALDLKQDVLSSYVMSVEAPVGGVHYDAVVLTKANFEIENVDNTSDLDKPISTATQTELTVLTDGKLDTVTAGTNITIDYTIPTSPVINASAAPYDDTWIQPALDDKVDDSQVLTDVPAGALFTDTVYDDTALTAYIDSQDALSFLITDHLDTSTGVSDGGSPIVLNGQGQIDPSMISTNSFFPIGPWTPVAGTEYPDPATYAHGSFWWVTGVTEGPESNSYTFVDVGGDLEGRTIRNGDFMIWGVDGWAIMISEMNPLLYYKLDGSSAITGSFQAGGFGLKNVLASVDSTDAIIQSELTSSLAGKVSSVVAGTNVQVDDTDTMNPIISATDTIYDDAWVQPALDLKVDDTQVLTDVPAGALFTDTTYSAFGTNTAGLVPAPTDANLDKFLMGNGSWSSVSSTLEGLQDTTITAAATGDLLSYQGGVWVNKALEISDLPTNLVVSDTTQAAGSDQILNMVSMTQVEYDLITPDSSTLYIIVG